MGALSRSGPRDAEAAVGYTAVMESRLDELELRYTELQDLVQSLSEVVYGQQRELDLLRSELAVLRSKVAEPGVVDARRDEKPPHY